MGRAPLSSAILFWLAVDQNIPQGSPMAVSLDDGTATQAAAHTEASVGGEEAAGGARPADTWGKATFGGTQGPQTEGTAVTGPGRHGPGDTGTACGQASKVTSLRTRRLTRALGREALPLPLSVTMSGQPGGLGGAPLQQSWHPQAGDRPPAPCQQTVSCSHCWLLGSTGSHWGLGPALALPLGCPCLMGLAQIQAPAFWHLPVWSQPPWHPQRL